MNEGDNPYAAPSDYHPGRKQPLGRPVVLRLDCRSYALANLIFGRVIAATVGLGALWNSLASLASIIHALQRGMTPERIFYLHLMLSLLWLVMMAILFAHRGRDPIVFWCELGDQIVLGRLGGPQEYSWSQVTAFDYEGIGNRTRIAVARAPVPKDGRRILVISLASGTQFRLKVRNELDAALKEFAKQVR